MIATLDHPAPVLERQPRLGGITGEMVARATARERRSQSDNTARTYRRAQAAFSAWCREMGVPSLPAPVEAIKVYLDCCIEERDWRPATVRSAFAAISHAHREAGYGDVVRDPSFRRFLGGVDRDELRRERQARPLREAEMTTVRLWACHPRKREKSEEAHRRGLADIAILQLMRDGMLRVGEAAALVWGDLEVMASGCGHLHVRRSKTDQRGQGKTQLLSPLAVADLRAAAPAGPADPRTLVFGLSASQMGRRIRQVCQHVGLGDGYSGHSPRVGMAQDLSAADIGTPALMEAGRWKSTAMVARYTEHQEIYHGAMARYYGLGPGGGGAPAQPALEGLW